MIAKFLKCILQMRRSRVGKFEIIGEDTSKFIDLSLWVWSYHECIYQLMTNTFPPILEHFCADTAFLMDYGSLRV